MDVPKRIIDEVAAKMLDNQIMMEDIAIVPNVFLIYLHKDDHAGIGFILNTLREQIIVRLNKEISKREKKGGADLGKLNKLLEFLAGFKIFGSGYKIIVPNDWDISFQTTDREVLVGDEVFEIKKGEICVVASYSEASSKSDDLASHLKTFVTIYKTDRKKEENFVVETVKPTNRESFKTGVDSKKSALPQNSNVLAVLTCKYNGEGNTETFEMVKNKITIGRDTTADFVLLKASNRISRKHLEINYKDGKFYLKSFGIYGTTLQGQTVPINEKVLDNTTRKLNEEVEIPARARIALAGGEVLIDFSEVINI